MKVTIERFVEHVNPDFEVGTLYEYVTDGDDVYVVLVTGEGRDDCTYQLFSGVVVYAHASTGRSIGQHSDGFSNKSFKPFKGTLKIKVK